MNGLLLMSLEHLRGLVWKSRGEMFRFMCGKDWFLF